MVQRFQIQAPPPRFATAAMRSGGGVLVIAGLQLICGALNRWRARGPQRIAGLALRDFSVHGPAWASMRVEPATAAPSLCPPNPPSAPSVRSGLCLLGLYEGYKKWYFSDYLKQLEVGRATPGLPHAGDVLARQ